MSDDDGSPSVHIGDVIAGKYRVERVLGRGAMGIVVAAMHLELGELRAIKFMSADALEEQGASERFLREAKAAARLKSQHVARVYDVGRLSSGAPYIVMEYLEGADLRARLKKGGPLSVDETVLYVVQACEAIGEAHAAGIVHRDLKPGNLFLTTGVGGAPCIKVFDFGIAKLVHAEGAGGGRDLTATAALLGTPKYMSPEQMRADRNGVDARSDIWALGVTLYNLLTRQTPFDGDSIAALCSAVLWQDPKPASALRPGLPTGIDAVIARCLAKNPADRYPSAAALAEALLPFGSDAVQRAVPRIHAPAPGSVPLATAAKPLSPDPALLSTSSTSSSTDGPLAAATGAPWAHATVAGVPRRSSWSGARIGGLVGVGVAVAVGLIAFVRLGASPPAPAVRPVAEVSSVVTAPVIAAPPATSSAAAVPPPDVATAAAPVVSVAAAVSVAPPALDAGAVHLHGGAKHAGKAAHPTADPFWSSRR